MSPLRVLWVDDDEELVADLSDYFSEDGDCFDRAESLQRARQCLAVSAYDLAIVDLTLPDGSGLSLVQDTPRTQVREFVMLTGHGSVKTAVEALRYQVFDYLTKPVELSELRNTLARVRRAVRLNAPAAIAAPVTAGPAAADAAPAGGGWPMMIGESAAVQHAQALLNQAATSEITVLLQGESGTGKEVAARTLHRLSPRADKPFVALNCSAVSPSLISSELFGHEKGSFTGANRMHRGIFERANGGTLFLDEITEMPMELQPALLRVLETGTVTRVGGDHEIPISVRVIAATNRDPLQAVDQGRFRLDLYYRLQVFPVPLPPLRERRSDIPLLAQHFLSEFSNGNPHTLSAATLDRLLAHDWPGNVRELRNVMQRACLLSQGLIEPEHLLLELAGPPAAAIAAPMLPSAGGGRLDEAQNALILKTLDECGGNRTRAAAQLGISVKTLYNRLKRMSQA